MVDGYQSETYDRDNPYYPRHAPRKKKFWQQSWFWPAIIGGILLILIILSATGNLKSPLAPGTNGTVVPESVVQLSDQEQQLMVYILDQKDKKVNDTAIRSKLLLAGFTENDINRGFELSDPVVQYIIEQLNNNVTKIQIIEQLLKDGMDPKTVQDKFAVVEKPKSSLGGFLAKNWFWLVLAGVAIYFIVKAGKGVDDKRAPKVYTLEECREYAEEKLEEKNVNHNPCKEYRNRPELKQYRFVYEEPIYPEFNSGKPWGHRAGARKYWLVAVGYDKELVDFRETSKDTDTYDFLYGMPKSFESRSASEYMRLRERSEQPIDMLKERERRTSGYDPYSYRRSYYPRRRTTYRRPRISPGPIPGYEEGGF